MNLNQPQRNIINPESFPPQIILDKQQVIACLKNLFNGNANIIQEANSYLMEMEANNSFLLILLDIFETESVKKNALYIILIYFFKKRI